MNDLQTRFRNALHRMVPAGQGMLLAVSGGRDSMVLLHLMCELRAGRPETPIAVAHLNHGLRGAEGAADTELVRIVARTLEIDCHVKTLEPGTLRDSSAGSLEESSRTARYEFLNELAVELALPFVVTAHHAGDQTETILFNLLRGTGLRGLQGMPVRREMHHGGVQLVRPMLTIKPTELDAYAADHGVAFSIDASNCDDRFARNRIRNQLLPVLERDYNVNSSDALLRLAEQVGGAMECLDAISDRLLETVILEQSPTVCRLAITDLLEQPSFLRRHVMTRLWMRSRWPRKHMSAAHWQRLDDLLAGELDSSLDLPEGIHVARSRGVLRLTNSRCDQPDR